MTVQGALALGLFLGFVTIITWARIAGVRSTQRALNLAHEALRDWRHANQHLGVADSPVALELLDICVDALEKHIEILFDPSARVFFQDLRDELRELRYETRGPNDDGGQPLPRELLGDFVLCYPLLRLKKGDLDASKNSWPETF